MKAITAMIKMMTKMTTPMSVDDIESMDAARGYNHCKLRIYTCNNAHQCVCSN